MARLSEQRARSVTKELLSIRGWDLRPVTSGGQLLEESEYRAFEHLQKIFNKKSKKGSSFGKPDFLLVDSSSGLRPLLVIDTKPSMADIEQSIKDTNHYGDACYEAGLPVLSAAVAGAEQELYDVKVQKKINHAWRYLKLHNKAIDWIPSPEQTQRLIQNINQIEVEPERPSEYVLTSQANRLNEIFRECKITDSLRPIYVATIMLALWYSDVSIDPNVVLSQINANAKKALQNAGKESLSNSLRVDEENEDLSSRAWEIIDILKKLNIRSFMQEHDYLGQLYETFFRYTGGNTIGQYFTPRHVIDLMCELVSVSPGEKVFDPACGTGGFLIGAMNRMIKGTTKTYKEALNAVKNNVYGIESEPATAALCITNMILRGDGKTGIIRANCFTKKNYPEKLVDCSLLNPPFPHDKKTDRPANDFIDRALLSTKDKGLVGSIVPYALLVKTKDWHKQILKNNKLLFIATMPPDLFNPYSTYNTAVMILQKGVPHNGSRVFLCRLTNDGYKVKKKNRIPKSGSQIPKLIDYYDQKKEEPEFSAYRLIDENSSEWSPEAYIESAPHQDNEFIEGFENSLRMQASFYIKYGYKLLDNIMSFSTINNDAFNAKSSLDISNLKFEIFRVGDYFDVILGGKEEVEDLDEDGNDPIVTTSEFDNGVTAWKKSNSLFHPPAITVATDGSTCSSFVQEFPFYAFYKVAILRAKKEFSIQTDALYFVSYLLYREKWRYVYARKFGKARILNTMFYCPSKNNGPDFDKMAELTRITKAYPIIKAFRDAYEKICNDKFVYLAKEWKQTRGAASTAKMMSLNPAYMRIINMGECVIPLILKELQAQPDHWFLALNLLTGINPIPKQSHGKIKEMTEAWLKWGQKQGYIE